LNAKIFHSLNRSIPNTHRILEELHGRGSKVTYLAHDICEEQLCASLESLSKRLSPKALKSAIQLRGIIGTYDDLIYWLASQTVFRNRRLVVIWLGNSLSSYSDPQFSRLLERLCQSLYKTQAQQSHLIFAVDGCEDEEEIKNAYDAPDSTSSKFVANGLRHANRVLHQEVFRAAEWEPRCSFDSEENSITWGYRTSQPRRIAFGDVTAMCKAGETIEIIQSRKRDRRNVRACTAGTRAEMAAIWEIPSVLWSKSSTLHFSAFFYLHIQGWYVLRVVG
jgi:uncharacterized SAM-dependent methyltransferase